MYQTDNTKLVQKLNFLSGKCKPKSDNSRLAAACATFFICLGYCVAGLFWAYYFFIAMVRVNCLAYLQ